MNFLAINIFFVLIGSSLTQHIDLCSENATLKDVPGGILPQLLQFLKGYSMQIFGCSEVSIPKNAIQFHLYNRENLNESILLNTSNLHHIDPTKTTIFQLHGWLCNHKDGRMPDMKNAYLSQYDYNVIIVDWSKLSINSYPDSVCSLQAAAEILGTFMCKMHTLQNVKLDNIHVVGHSLGAHLAGLTGQAVRQICGRSIGRITGLDPSGPYFQSVSIDKRLDESDANMVDVIHTNMGIMGYYGSCGTIDFFPNCGSIQPGCCSLLLLANVTNLLNFPISFVNCHHMRSLDYMVESIVNPKFVAKRCDFCPGIPLLGLCAPNMLFPYKMELMGENCSSESQGTKYHLTTNSYSPFAQGYEQQ